jgi:hypothetical protein
VESLRTAWNPLAGQMRAVAPYLKAVGKATGAVSPERIDIDVRRTLHELIQQLAAERTPAMRVGGLHKWLNDDGRVLWLCPRHYKPLQTRVES